MIRVLFDKNVPYPLRRHLTECQVETAEEKGWRQVSNGELITSAEDAGYQVFVTCDQNILYQQNLSHRKISLIVLGSNIWPSVRVRLPGILEAFRRIVSGSFEFIEIHPPTKQRRLESGQDS